MANGRSLSLLASLAALALAIAAALSIPSIASADPFGGQCVRITMVSADAEFKLHLVNENSTRLGLNNHQVGSSIIVKAPMRIGILIDHTGDVKWEHEHLENGQIGFEDHVDYDYNDAVIRVEPVSCSSRNSGPAPAPKPAVTALEVSFDDAAYSVNEGSSVSVTVNVSPNSDRALEIPVSVTGGTADSDDYSMSGLTGGSLSLSSGESSASFTIEAAEDSDSGAETINLSFGNLPGGVSEGAQSTAQVTIEDPVAELEVSFDEAAYTVNEGSSVTVTVNVSPDADRSLDIPVSVDNDTAESSDYSVSGLAGGKLSFASGDSSKTFTVSTVDDSDRNDETVDLSFGQLPDDVNEGTQATSELTINDTTPVPNNNRRNTRSSIGGFGGDIGGSSKPSNHAPEFSEGANAERSVAEDAANPSNVGNPVTATDADGDNLTYTLEGPDAASFTLDSGTGQLRTVIALDYETKASYHVIVYVYDTRGGRDSIVVNIRVTDVAEQPAVVQSPVPIALPQLAETLAPEPTETPTPRPTATPAPQPTATPAPSPTPEPTAPLWMLQSQWYTPTPAATAVTSPTATPEPTPTEAPTATPDLSGNSQSAMFVEIQDGGPLGEFQFTSVKSSVAPLPEESRRLLIWPIILMAVGIAMMVVSIGMLISGGSEKGETGNRDFILNS